MNKYATGPNRTACDGVVRYMRSEGVIEPAHEAQITATLELAAAVDASPGRASLWEQYRAALDWLATLSEAGKNDIERLLESLRTPMGDSTPA